MSEARQISSIRFWLGIVAFAIVIMSYTMYLFITTVMSLTITTALGYSILQAFMAILLLVILPLLVFMWAFWSQIAALWHTAKRVFGYMRT